MTNAHTPNDDTWLVSVLGVQQFEVEGKLLTEEQGYTILDPKTREVRFSIRGGAEAVSVQPKP